MLSFLRKISKALKLVTGLLPDVQSHRRSDGSHLVNPPYIHLHIFYGTRYSAFQDVAAVPWSLFRCLQQDICVQLQFHFQQKIRLTTPLANTGQPGIS